MAEDWTHDLQRYPGPPDLSGAPIGLWRELLVDSLTSEVRAITAAFADMTSALERLGFSAQTASHYPPFSFQAPAPVSKPPFPSRVRNHGPRPKTAFGPGGKRNY